MRGPKVSSFRPPAPYRTEYSKSQVDENLYYRAIKKDDTSHARRDQTHGLTSAGFKSLQSPSSGKDSRVEVEESRGDKLPQPPHLFTNAESLLKMSKAHNVSVVRSSLLHLR